MIKGKYSVGVKPDADPEGSCLRTCGDPGGQISLVSQRPDIADPAVQPHLSAERGSGCWITAAITPQTLSSAGCDQSCRSGRQGLVAVLSNHSRGCKLKRWFVLFLRVSQPWLSLKCRFWSWRSCLSQGWNITVKLKGSILLLWEARVLKPSYWCSHGFLAAPANSEIILNEVDTGKKWQNGIWNREVALACWSILSIGENCIWYREAWLRGMAQLFCRDSKWIRIPQFGRMWTEEQVMWERSLKLWIHGGV